MKKVVGDREVHAPAAGAYIGAGSMQVGESSMQECDSRMKGAHGFDGSVIVKKEVELLGLCEEVVSLFKVMLSRWLYAHCHVAECVCSTHEVRQCVPSM
jgi:hypothetical protein